MNYLKSSDQNDDVIIEELDEVIKTHGFYSNTLCVVVGCIKEGIGQLVETVMQVGRGGDMLSKSIKTTQNMNYVDDKGILKECPDQYKKIMPCWRLNECLTKHLKDVALEHRVL